VRALFGREEESEGELMLVTTDGIPGFELEALAGVVAGVSSDQVKAIDQMERYARERGAHAVVGIRIDSFASGGAVFADRHCIAYGTAVRVGAA